MTTDYNYQIQPDYQTNGVKGTIVRVESKLNENRKKKRCTECRESYPLTIDYWHMHSVKRDGYQDICRPCQIILMRDADYGSAGKHDAKRLARRK